MLKIKRIVGASVLGTGFNEAIHVIFGVVSANAPLPMLQRTMRIDPKVAKMLDLQPL
jgi:pyruvate/2-oxoglutarate dehydrogenase complex dihydrolipoamide dehydrogenase (E3) component